MAVITSTSGTDWSTVGFDAIDIGDETSIFYGRLFQEITAFNNLEFDFENPVFVSTSKLVVNMLSGGQLTIVGSLAADNPVITSIGFDSFGGESFLVKGTVDLSGPTDSITEYSYTRDGHTLTGKGSIAVVSDSETGEFSGTVTSVSLLTSNGYKATLTGNATASGDQFGTEFAGTFTKLVITGPGSSTVTLQASGILLTGIGDYATVGDLLAAVTTGNDSVSGGAGNDSLASFAGNDTLVGLAGNDTLDGGAGNDSMDGGLGNDFYVGSAGNDIYVVAQAGDVIGLGADSMDAGTDTVRLALAGHALHDLSGFTELENLVFTGTGAVSLVGNGSSNSLSGGAGNDSIIGGDGADSLAGNAGNDTLDGGVGADTLTGGAGNDYLLADDAGDNIVELAAGGTDTVEISYAGDVSLAGALAFIENLVMANDSAVGAGNALNNVLSSKNGHHTLAGGLGNDTYNISSASFLDKDAITEDSIFGSGTKDLVILTLAPSGLGSLDANVENLTLLSTGPGVIYAGGNALANVMTGAAGTNNELHGGAGNDTLLGNAGNDLLEGGDDNDALAGGLGNDLYLVGLKNLAAGALSDTVADTGGTDSLLVMSNGTVTSFTYTLAAAIENLNIVSIADGVNAVITGNAANNAITGNGGNNKIDGAAGNDTITGGTGNDTLLGGAGNDSLDGGAGNDSHDGGLGDDTYAGGDGDDSYVMAQALDAIATDTLGNDTVRVVLATSTYLNLVGKDFLENVVFTGTGPVTITGNDAGNSLVGGAGADTISGGLGNDTIGVNSLLDSVSGGADTDTVVSSIAYSLVGRDDIENLTLGGTANKATGNGGTNVLTGNAAANTLDGGGGADTMIGGAGADVYVVDVTGDVITETIAGAAGGIDQVNTSADFSLAGSQIENATVTSAAGHSVTGSDLANKLTGGIGHDTLLGGVGNDTLTGNAGNDRLDGGAGVDSMVGGIGNDTYVVDFALDKITEAANAGTDTVESSISFVLTAAGNLENITLTGADAINATGNAFANVLIGNAGNNTILGGDGADTVDGGGGNDSIDGGAGTDTATSSTTSVNLASFTSVENILLAGEGNLDATGNNSANFITGNSGDNALRGNDGNDILDGGGGTDTALFTGDFDDYTIEGGAGGTYVVMGADGTDTLLNMEKVSFTDQADLVLSELVFAPPAPTPTLIPELDGDTGDTMPGAISHLQGTGTIEISYSFMGSVSVYDGDDSVHDGFATPSAELQAAITAALQLWSDVTNINFSLVADSNEGGIFRFGTELLTLAGEGLPNENTFGYAYLPQSGFANGELWTGDVWINRNGFLYDDSENADFVPGTSVFTTLVHEIGHTLGLQHPFDDGEPEELFLEDGAFDNNNLYTIMAYYPAPHSTLIEWQDVEGVYWYGNGGTVDASTPMLYDISTVQDIYGVNTSTRSGDDVYGAGAADSRYAFGPTKPFFITIYDGGGTDTVNASGYSLPSIIDLQPGHFSSIGMSNFLGINNLGNVVDDGFDPDDARDDEGYNYLTADPDAPFGVLPQAFQDQIALAITLTELYDPDFVWPDQGFNDFFNGQYDGTDNLTIAETAVIENAVGGSGKDVLIGNDWSNRLAGGLGNDTLTGGGLGDSFVFDKALGATNVDLITDFLPGIDQIVLDKIFGAFAALGAGPLAAGALHVFAVPGGTLEADDRIRYNQSTGDLFYDPDGNGVGVTVKFATLTGLPALTSTDFLVV